MQQQRLRDRERKKGVDDEDHISAASHHRYHHFFETFDC